MAIIPVCPFLTNCQNKNSWMILLRIKYDRVSVNVIRQFKCYLQIDISNWKFAWHFYTCLDSKLLNICLQHGAIQTKIAKKYDTLILCSIKFTVGLIVYR
jgi:hypothetical protein